MTRSVCAHSRITIASTHRLSPFPIEAPTPKPKERVFGNHGSEPGDDEGEGDDFEGEFHDGDSMCYRPM